MRKISIILLKFFAVDETKALNVIENLKFFAIKIILDVNFNLLIFLIIIKLIVMIIKEDAFSNRFEIYDISISRFFNLKKSKILWVRKS